MHLDFGSDLTTIVLAAGATLIRPATAFLTKEATDKGVIGAFAGIVLAGLTAGGAALAHVGNIASDWTHVLGAAGAALVVGATASVTLWSGRLVEWIHAHTD